MTDRRSYHNIDFDSDNESPADKNVTTETEDTAEILRQATTNEHTAHREDLVIAVVNCRACELAIAL
jgi:hypothetical protein